MSPYVFAFCASFIFVALKAAQQLNVVRFQWIPIIPVSIGMTACEFYLVSYIVKVGASAPGILSVGVGAGLGAMTTMYFVRRKDGQAERQ